MSDNPYLRAAPKRNGHKPSHKPPQRIGCTIIDGPEYRGADVERSYRNGFTAAVAEAHQEVIEHQARETDQDNGPIPDTKVAGSRLCPSTGIGSILAHLQLEASDQREALRQSDDVNAVELASIRGRCQALAEIVTASEQHKLSELEVTLRHWHQRLTVWCQADLSNIIEPPDLQAIPEQKQQRQRDPGPLPQRLLNPGGFMGSFVAWCLRTAHRPQPELALAGAVTAMAGLCGRLVRDNTGMHPNVYLAAVCETGGGKDHPRDCIKRVLDAGGLSERIIEGFKSGAAVVSHLDRSPVLLALWDELGLVLQSLNGGNRAPPHITELRAKLLALYGSSGSVFAGDAYADETNMKRIVNPFLALMGSSTPSTLFESLNAESVLSGFLNRLMFFHGCDGVRLCHATYEDVPSDLADSARWWAQQAGLWGQQPDTAPDFRVMTYSHAAYGAVRDYVDFTEDRLALIRDEWERCLRMRQTAMVRKLAILHSLSLYSASDVIEQVSVDWATSLVEHCTERLVWHASTRIAANDYESDLLEVIRFVEGQGEQGADRTTLLRQFRRIKAADLDKLMQHAIQCGDVAAESVETTKGKRPKTVYRAD